MPSIYLRCDRCRAVLDRTDRTATGTYHPAEAHRLRQEARELGWTGTLTWSFERTANSAPDLCPSCSA